MSVEFDSRSWPLLTVRLYGRDDDDAIDELLTGLSRNLRRSRCAVVFDTTEVIYPSLSDAQRWTRQEGEWLRRNQPLVARNCCAVGFVITNPALRFLLSGVLLIAPLPCAHAVVATQLEARAFCTAQLRATGTSLRPPSIAPLQTLAPPAPSERRSAKPPKIA
jgi:hypothetical protein